MPSGLPLGGKTKAKARDQSSHKMGKIEADLRLGGELKQWRATNRLTKLPESKLTCRRAGTKASGQPSGKMGKIEVDLPLGSKLKQRRASSQLTKWPNSGLNCRQGPS